MAQETQYRFEFVDGTAELVRHGSPRYWELIGDGHTPVGELPESDGISDAFETYLAARFGAGLDATDTAVAAALESGVLSPAVVQDVVDATLVPFDGRVDATEAELSGRLSEETLSATIETAIESDIANPSGSINAAARAPFPNGLTGLSYYDISTGFYGARGKLITSRKMLDQSRVAGYGLKRAACIGHSNVAGAGPVVAGVSTWPDRLRETLRQQGITRAGTGVVLAQNGTGAPDGRYTFSAGWSSFATGSPAMKATAVGETATFATGITGTQIDVYTFDTTKQMSVTIDGVAKTAIVGTPSSAVRKFSFTGLANTTHTVVLTTTVAGQDHYVVGIECHSGEGLSLSNLGIAGSSIDQWANASYFMASGIMRYLDPTLVFLQCQVNDAKMGRAASTWKSYANTVIGYIKEAGEAVIVIDPTPNPVGTGPYPDIPSVLWQQYRQAALDLGDETATPVIDLSEIFGNYAVASAAGWMFDSVHQSLFGSDVITRVAADLLQVT